MLRKKWTDVWVCIFIFTLAIVFSMQSDLNIWYNGESGVDSSVFKTVAFMMSRGHMPYVDIFDHKGPLIYLLNWVGMLLSYWRGIWVVECVTIFVTFGMIYKIARLLCGKLMSCIVVLAAGAMLFLYYDKGNLVEEYAMPFIAIAIYIFADYFLNNKVNKKRLILCGLSFGAVLMLRPNMIATWIVFSLAVLIQSLHKKEIKPIGFFITWFGIGVGLIIIPILLWLILNGAFEAFINDYFLFNFAYSDRMSNGKVLTSRGDTFLYFTDKAFTLPLLMVLAFSAKMKNRFWNCTYFLCYIMNLIFICIAGIAFIHYGMILVPLTAYPLAIVGGILEREILQGKGIGIVLLSFGFAALVYPKWVGGIERTLQSYDARMISNRSENTEMVVDYIVNHVEEDEKISIFGNWNIIYVLSKREPASKYSYLYPIADVDQGIMREYIEDLENAPPKLIIVLDNNELEKESIQAFLEKHEYQLVLINGIKIYELGER